MKTITGIYQNKHMHWVGDGFPVYNLFSYDRLGQTISPFYFWTTQHLIALNQLQFSMAWVHIHTVDSKL
jgi:hypothetical protein